MLPSHNMSQPVKLSDGVVLDARLTGEVAERSIAGQIEYWANLGRAVEQLIEGAQALALGRRAAALSSCLESVDSKKGAPRGFLRQPVQRRSRHDKKRQCGSAGLP